MTKTWLLSLSMAAVLGAITTSPARADILDARFSGTVASQTGTASAIGSAISGEFIYNTNTSAFLTFTIGGVSIAPGYGSTAAITPDGFSAIYRAQLSPVQQGGTLNNTFTVDLEGLNPWPTTNAVALLTNTSALATNLDTVNSPNNFIPSTFSYVTGNSNGTNIRQVAANLTSIQVAVPEPASIALLAVACAGVCIRRRRV